MSASRNFDDTIFKTNLEAAVRASLASCACAILAASSSSTSSTWKTRSTRSAVLLELSSTQLSKARDHTRLTVNGFTQLGLVEMTRKRTRESLAHVLCQPCPTCLRGARCQVKTARTVCLRNPPRVAARSTPVQCPSEYPHPGWPGCGRSASSMKRSQAPGHAFSDFIGKARFAAIRAQLFAGTVRHRADVSAWTDCLARLTAKLMARLMFAFARD